MWLIAATLNSADVDLSIIAETSLDSTIPEEVRMYNGIMGRKI